MHQKPITIDIVEILDAIDRRGSFAKAAEELNKATSALSYAVQKLEEQLEISIFQRQGRRSVLTPAGRLILDEGRKLLSASVQLADRARELATGWEPKLRIALESTLDYPEFFQLMDNFLADHPTMEIDICESVLNGGWELLEQDKVDLIVGNPGPVPQQKGFRSQPMASQVLVPVIAAHHPMAASLFSGQQHADLIESVRRVVSHDTASVNVARSAGLSFGKQVLYVQTVDQKVNAILAGLGVGHLPRYRVQPHLDNNTLIELNIDVAEPDNFIAWRLGNKGKALQELVRRLNREAS